jgi:7-keto-8-aminopelargonate synthetase-like enzyme
MQKYGLGTATSRAGYGNAPPTSAVEELAAQFWDSESGFYFPSGYLGNSIILSVLAPSASVLLVDEHSHYSIVDACRIFGLPVHHFAHRDAQALSEALENHVRPGQIPIVISDGVFAALGSIAPVLDYLEVIQKYDRAMLCLDDCHAFGVLGERGRGTFEHCGIAQEGINELPDSGNPSNTSCLFAVGTLSKAFGGYGGIVCGTRSFIESTKASSHFFRGASAPPIPAAAACAAALKLVASKPELVAQVQRNALLLKQGLRELGLDIDGTPVPIVGLTIGDAPTMQRIQQQLADDGILIAYCDHYSGLGKCGALRIATFATHTEEMIHRLVESLGRHL